MKFTKNNTLIGIAVAAILVIAGQYLFTHTSKPLPESDSIKSVANEQEFKTILDNAGSKMIVFDLYADWCGPCRALHPTLETLAAK